MLCTASVVGYVGEAKPLNASGLPAGVSLYRIRLGVPQGRDKESQWWTVVGRGPSWMLDELQRGTVVACAGRPSLEQWTDVRGEPRASLRLDADRIMLVGKPEKRRGASAQAEGNAPAQPQLPPVPQVEPTVERGEWAQDYGHDDIPF
jgi:single-stranded DNA-binding protein